MDNIKIRSKLIEKVSLAGESGLTLSQIHNLFRGCTPRITAKSYQPVMDQLEDEGLIRMVPVARQSDVTNRIYKQIIIKGRAVNPACNLCETKGYGPQRVNAPEYRIDGRICLGCYRDLKEEEESKRSSLARRRTKDREAKARKRAEATAKGKSPSPLPAVALIHYKTMEEIKAEIEAKKKADRPPDADKRFGLSPSHRAEFERIRKTKIAELGEDYGTSPCQVRVSKEYHETFRRS